MGRAGRASGFQNYRAAHEAFSRLLTDFPKSRWGLTPEPGEAIRLKVQLQWREEQANRLKRQLQSREEEATRLTRQLQSSQEEAFGLKAQIRQLRRVDLGLEQRR